MQERYLLAGRHLAATHRVAVRQVQWCDGVVGQQLAASFEGGACQLDIAGVEQRESLVEGGLR
jgi:hypothetical protein